MQDPINKRRAYYHRPARSLHVLRLEKQKDTWEKESKLYIADEVRSVHRKLKETKHEKVKFQKKLKLQNFSLC